MSHEPSSTLTCTVGGLSKQDIVGRLIISLSGPSWGDDIDPALTLNKEFWYIPSLGSFR